MTLDDSELLEKPTLRQMADVGGSGVPFKMISMFCRNTTHNRCLWNSCECECHKHKAEELKQLRAELTR